MQKEALVAEEKMMRLSTNWGFSCQSEILSLALNGSKANTGKISLRQQRIAELLPLYSCILLTPPAPPLLPGVRAYGEKETWSSVRASFSSG